MREGSSPPSVGSQTRRGVLWKSATYPSQRIFIVVSYHTEVVSYGGLRGERAKTDAVEDAGVRDQVGARMVSTRPFSFCAFRCSISRHRFAAAHPEGFAPTAADAKV